MKESNLDLSDREIALVRSLRVLPVEVRATLENTIESQADRYDPTRTRVRTPPKLALVANLARR